MRGAAMPSRLTEADTGCHRDPGSWDAKTAHPGMTRSLLPVDHPTGGQRAECSPSAMACRWPE